MTDTQNKIHFLLLDLKNDAYLISEYEQYHRTIWPEIQESIKAAGILRMEIYRWQNRLVMMIEVTDDFSFEKKQQMDENNSKVQEWEKLMWRFQQPLPATGPGEKWQIMSKVFEM